MNPNYIINNNEVHIWNYLLDVTNPDVDFFYSLLNEEEKKGIDKIKLQGVRNRRIISKAIVKDIISKYLGINISQIKFLYNRFGKPVLPEEINLSGLRFNISHSNGLGIIALIKKNQIGVDIEEIVELEDINDIIHTCFSKNEQYLFNDLELSEKTNLFYKIWTGKEAFIKAIGQGFSFPLQNISFGLDDDNKIIINEIADAQENLNNWKAYNFSSRENYTSTVVVNLNSFLTKKFEWNLTEIINR